MRGKNLLVTAVSSSALLFSIMGCDFGTKPEDENSDIIISKKSLIITEVDDLYKTGWFGVVDSNSTYTKGITIDPDAKVKQIGDVTYILERSENNIMRLNSDGTVDYQVKIEDGFNLHDIAIVSETVGYACGNSANDIKIFNPTTGKVTASIDISDYKVNNTSPNATAMVIYNGKLYVALQMLDGYDAVQVSKILVVDIATNKIDKAIDCKGKNVSQITLIYDALYIVSGGTWNTGDGTVEKLNLIDETIETIFNTTANGGDIIAITHIEDEEFYVSSYVGWGSIPVSKVDFTTDIVEVKLSDVVNAFGGLTYDKEFEILYVAEQGVTTEDAKYGIYKYDVATESGELIETTLKPSSITLR